MLTADLDRELAAALAASGTLPAAAANPADLRGSWRPAPDGNPAGFATPLPVRLARLAGRSPAEIAGALAARLAAVPWVESASHASGHLTITVTPRALVASAAAQAAAGPACANSTILHGTVATVQPWPDLAAAPGWRQAWQDHAAAMAGRLAAAAGATSSGRERGRSPSQPLAPSRSPVRTATAYLGPCSVRYRLARTLPAQVARLADLMRPDWAHAGAADPLHVVQQAYAAAASALRWGADLGLSPAGPADLRPDLLGSAQELELLGLLCFLPVRTAAAARRGRPDELPRYLEQVADSWQRCRLARPALPFGGQAAPRDAVGASARLQLAGAVRAVLAAGLALTGVTPAERF